MTAESILMALVGRGVRVSISPDGQKLVLDAPVGAISDVDRDLLRSHKTELLAWLNPPTEAPALDAHAPQSTAEMPKSGIQAHAHQDFHVHAGRILVEALESGAITADDFDRLNDEFVERVAIITVDGTPQHDADRVAHDDICAALKQLDSPHSHANPGMAGLDSK